MINGDPRHRAKAVSMIHRRSPPDACAACASDCTWSIPPQSRTTGTTSLPSFTRHGHRTLLLSLDSRPAPSNLLGQYGRVSHHTTVSTLELHWISHCGVLQCQLSAPISQCINLSTTNSSLPYRIPAVNELASYGEQARTELRLRNLILSLDDTLPAETSLHGRMTIILDTLFNMFKSDVMNGVDVKRFVRYFYDPPPKYDDMSGASIWLLGKEYKCATPKPVTTTDHEDIVEVESSTDSRDPSEITTSSTDERPRGPRRTSTTFDDAQYISSEGTPSLSNDPADGGWPIPFLDDFESKIWMTYRSHFPPIPRSADPNVNSAMTFAVRLRNLTEKEGFTSDTGWGCMIRSGQSLLANALVMLHLGRDWRRRDGSGAASMTEAQILSHFADSSEAPFSIHRFVHHGAASCGKHPGQWFGPSATASCIAALSTECAAIGLKVYVTTSTSDVYEDRFRSISAASPDDRTITPTLILLGTRLGPDRITPVYFEALKQCLTYSQSIGIAGGRPSSSHYFIGCQNDTFFYLDPHETRPALAYHTTPEAYTAEEVSTCHTRRLRGVKISEMDPSMLIGFLIKDEDDWEDFKKNLSEVRGKKIVNWYAKEPPVPGEHAERREAVDEVETFDDSDEEEDGVTVTGEEGRE